MKRREFLKTSALATASLAIAPVDKVLAAPVDLDFSVEHLNLDGLWPVQRVVLKAFYGIPLDDTKYFPVRTHWKDGAQTMTEKQYLEYAQSSINEVTPGHKYNELILVTGRRGGKDTILEHIYMRELGYLCGLDDAHAYYGIPKHNPINISHVIPNPDMGALYMNRIHQINGHPDEKIKLRFLTSKSKGVRGPGSHTVVLNELAHFTDTQGHDNSELVYDALTPSVAAWAPKDLSDAHISIGPSEGKIVIVSTPKSGFDNFLFRHYQNGFHHDWKSTLCFQIPTWEMNPSIPTAFLEKKWACDPYNFMIEYGADFCRKSRTSSSV